jgi:hypothetical protein
LFVCLLVCFLYKPLSLCTNKSQHRQQPSEQNNTTNGRRTQQASGSASAVAVAVAVVVVTRRPVLTIVFVLATAV